MLSRLVIATVMPISRARFLSLLLLSSARNYQLGEELPSPYVFVNSSFYSRLR